MDLRSQRASKDWMHSSTREAVQHGQLLQWNPSMISKHSINEVVGSFQCAQRVMGNMILKNEKQYE